jgi:hypothetical protein
MVVAVLPSLASPDFAMYSAWFFTVGIALTLLIPFDEKVSREKPRLVMFIFGYWLMVILFKNFSS